jgi:hypothetical protein
MAWASSSTRPSMSTTTRPLARPLPMSVCTPNPHHPHHRRCSEWKLTCRTGFRLFWKDGGDCGCDGGRANDVQQKSCSSAATHTGSATASALWQTSAAAATSSATVDFASYSKCTLLVIPFLSILFYFEGHVINGRNRLRRILRFGLGWTKSLRRQRSLNQRQRSISVWRR